MILNQNKLLSLIILILILSFKSCKFYSFTGASIPAGTETFQVNYFENVAGNRPGSTIEPGLDRDFTLALQDILINQTNLNLTNTNGDLVFEGEIVEYAITPMSATAQNTAAQNRLTISINVRYFNVKKKEDNYETRFSFYYDFPAEQQLYDIKDTAHGEIFERITQDVFNASLAKW